jgi:hypothetical protein
MPKVIFNKLTKETLPDTAENRIATYVTEFDRNYSMYKQKYTILSYGTNFMPSTKAELEEAGLWEEHKRILREHMLKAIKELKHEYSSLEQECSGSDYVNRLIADRKDKLEYVIQAYDRAYERGDILLPEYVWED